MSFEINPLGNAVARGLRAPGVVIAPADPAGAAAQACMQAYFQELSARLGEHFDPALGPSADPEDLVPPFGCFLLAMLDGAPTGCGALKITGQGCGEIKRMWVAPSARGRGVAQRLLDALEAQAIAAGVRALRLDTNKNLTEARALYAHNGYAEIPAYNDNPYAHHWFEKRLP